MLALFSKEAVIADEDLNSIVLGILVATAGWTALYTLLCLYNSSNTYEWNCRLVSTVHALVAIGMTSWSGFVQGPWPFTDPGGPNTRLQHWTCIVCGGYFIYDLMWCLFFQTESASMIFHHLLSIYGQLLVLLRGRNGTEMMATIWGSELTNPFLQTRWFLRETERHTTWYAEIVDQIFMIMFTIVRIFIGGALLYCELTHPRPDWVAKAGGATMYALSWLFWIMIVNYAIRKYTKMYKSWQDRQRMETSAHAHVMETSDAQRMKTSDAQRMETSGRVQIKETSASQNGDLGNKMAPDGKHVHSMNGHSHKAETNGHVKSD